MRFDNKGAIRENSQMTRADTPDLLFVIFIPTVDCWSCENRNKKIHS